MRNFESAPRIGKYDKHTTMNHTYYILRVSRLEVENSTLLSVVQNIRNPKRACRRKTVACYVQGNLAVMDPVRQGA